MAIMNWFVFGFVDLVTSNYLLIAPIAHFCECFPKGRVTADNRFKACTGPTPPNSGIWLSASNVSAKSRDYGWKNNGRQQPSHQLPNSLVQAVLCFYRIPTASPSSRRRGRHMDGCTRLTNKPRCLFGCSRSRRKLKRERSRARAFCRRFRNRQGGSAMLG